jgi:hypothetical protein
MEILNKSIDTFSFKDVVDFCKLGYREGTQIDYKRDLPKDGLARHFAAFSNTLGGVIIIGVEEDKKTGIPIAWNGVDNDAKLIERIYQWAGDVDPHPLYKVHPTNEENGKIFILVRIYEGDRTPYYVQNNANIWVRTGSIGNPIDTSSPDWTELLFGKKEKAQLARSNYLNRARDVYESALNRAEHERLRLIKPEWEQYNKQNKDIPQSQREPFTAKYYSQELGSQAAMCTFVLQPFFPARALTEPGEIKRRLNEISHPPNYYSLWNSAEPIPEGVLSFEWNQHTGLISCKQIYASGLLYLSGDVLSVRADENTVSTLTILARLFMSFKQAINFYRIFGYQGGLQGSLTLKGVKGALVYPLEWDNRMRTFMHGVKRALMSDYSWELADLDTLILFDEKTFQAYFIELAKRIEWDLGYDDTDDNLVKQFLKANGWLVA